MKEKIKKLLKFPKIRTCILIPLAVLLLVIAIVADCIISSYWGVIAAAFSDTDAIIDPDLMDTTIEKSLSVNREMLEEGSVLLKNDDVLPIPSNTKKVNVYGIMSGGMYLNTSGSGAVNNPNSVTLKTAFEDAGFSVNSDLWNLIEKNVKPSTGAGIGGIQEGSITGNTVNEISISAYNGASSWAAAKEYSDYAVVTFGRAGNEGGDVARTALQLNSSELALLKELHDRDFKVITLINSSHVMTLGDVEQYSDAILWIGGPGLNGTVGIVNVLSGEVSPSGRLVDTWMYDHKTSSTYYTADTYNYTGAAKGGFTNYNEGIYVGYRWYETADAEGYWDNKGGYEKVVAYPFGYGLSYGELSEEITDVSYADGTFTFTVKAMNANSVPSKNVFELYVEKPYVNGQSVEVSKVELIAFAKSDAITSEDAEGYTTTLTVDESELASYVDSANGGKGAYVLAEGKYNFYLASGETGSHCWTLKDGKHNYSYELSEVVYAGDNTRAGDVVAAENQLGADKNAIAVDDNNSGYKALKRENGFANASDTIFKNISNVTLTSDSPLVYNFSEKGYTSVGEYKGEIAENLKTGQKKTYSFADLYNKDKDGNPLYETVIDEETGKLISKTVIGSVDYDDPRWDYLISQMTVDDLELLVGRGGWMTAKIDSIDKPKGVDYDGPSGLSNLMSNSIGKQSSTTSFCSEPVMASTWNVELVEELGEAVAMEANVVGQSGWYAPGANIHRTPFGGRNAEYFSEDAYISGVMCAVESRGAMNLGLYCMAKHFAFNDIEANRVSFENCWMSEQAAREIYLRAYEIGCKNGDIPGLMISYMWLNGEWLGANYNVLTGIVRNEWGFNGMITTDNSSGGNYKWVSLSRLLYAGGDIVLSEPRSRVGSALKNSDEGVSAMKTASKHILYTIASAYLNRLEAAKTGPNTFIPYYVLINVALFGGAAACLISDGILIALYLVKKKKLSGVDAGIPEETEKEAANMQNE